MIEVPLRLRNYTWKPGKPPLDAREITDKGSPLRLAFSTLSALTNERRAWHNVGSVLSRERPRTGAVS